jgi:hypothetical protein
MASARRGVMDAVVVTSCLPARFGQLGLQMGSGGPRHLCLQNLLEVAVTAWLYQGLRCGWCVAAGLSGLYGPVWFQPGQCGAWCAPAALSDRRTPRGDGGGGFLLHGCRATVLMEVGSEAWWWCSVVLGFFVVRGREKSMSACPTRKRCHHWWHHSFLKGILGCLILLYSLHSFY